MFRRRSLPIVTSNDSTSGSGGSSEVVSRDEIPTLKRRHSLIHPIPESLFRTENDKSIEINEISFDPFNNTGIRKSKSVAEGMLMNNRKLYNGFDTMLRRKTLKKNVTFNDKLEFNSQEAKENEAPGDNLEGVEVKGVIHCTQHPIDMSTDISFEAESKQEIIDSPTKSQSSQYSSGESVDDTRLKFKDSNPYKSNEIAKQRTLRNLLSDGTEKEVVVNEDTSESAAQNLINESDEESGFSVKLLYEKGTFISRENMALLLSNMQPFSTPCVEPSTSFVEKLKKATLEANIMAAKVGPQILNLEKELDVWKRRCNELSSLNDRDECDNKELDSLRRELYEMKTNQQELQNTIAPLNSENLPVVGFLHEVIYQNRYLKAKQVDNQTTNKGEKLELLQLREDLYENNKSKLSQLKEHQETLDSFKESYYLKAKECMDLKSQLFVFEQEVKKLEEYIVQRDSNIKSLESKLPLQILESSRIKKTNVQLRECCSTFNKQFQELKIEMEAQNNEVESSHLQEIELQTAQIKSLIKDNSSFLDILNKIQTKNESLIQSNQYLINRCMDLIAFLLDELFDYLDYTSWNVGELLEKVSNSLFTKEDDFQLLDSIVQLVRSSLSRLLDAFNENKRNLKIEIEYRHNSNQQVLDKFVRIMLSINDKRVNINDNKNMVKPVKRRN